MFYVNNGFNQNIEYPCFLLLPDNWDDFRHKTLFQLNFCKDRTSSIEIGTVKILAYKDSNDEGGRTVLPEKFSKLEPDQFISLGQNIKYYRRLATLRKEYEEIDIHVLKSLCDALKRKNRNQEIFRSHGWTESILRNKSAESALKYGGYYFGLPHDKIEPPELNLHVKNEEYENEFEIKVSFKKYESLPNRIFALVGSNGSGKTTILSKIPYLVTKGLIKKREVSGLKITNSSDSKFSRVIALSYNQYDSFAIPRESADYDPFSDEVFNYKYCGVRNIFENQIIREIQKSKIQEPDPEQLIKNITNHLRKKESLFQDALARKIQDALVRIKDDDREDILELALKRLIPEDIINYWKKADELGERYSNTSAMLKKLSAGQKILMASLVDLVAFLDQGSLLLIDEPEANLHPGTISTFFAVLQDLLNEFDSFAIVASHSPIFLQQLPARYTCILRKNGLGYSASKMKFETFGEDLGTITEKAFGLLEPEQDFRNQIDIWLKNGMSTEEISEMFNNRLGGSAHSYLISREIE